jgi:hypothetical protein
MGGWGRVVGELSVKYPLGRAVLFYAALWPTSNLAQQLLQRRGALSWKEALRFGFLGATYVAPTTYGAFRLLGTIFPGQTLKTSITKVLISTRVAPSARPTEYSAHSILDTQPSILSLFFSKTSILVNK